MTGGRRRKLPLKDEQEICRRYLEGESSVELAPVYGISDKAVRDILARHGVQQRSRREAAIVALAAGRHSLQQRREVEAKPPKLSCKNGWESSAHEEFRRQVYGDARY